MPWPGYSHELWTHQKVTAKIIFHTNYAKVIEPQAGPVSARSVCIVPWYRIQLERSKYSNEEEEEDREHNMCLLYHLIVML